MLSRLFTRNRKFALVAGVVTAAILLITASWRSSPEPNALERGVMTAVTPLLESTSLLSGFLEEPLDFLFGGRRLREENRMLREEVVRLRREAAARTEEGIAYKRLADMLDFRQRTGFSMTAAAVIGRDATNLFQTVLINKGGRDGLRRDMPVVTHDGAVGKIIKVYKRSSQVLLLTDRSSGIDALVQRTRDQGVVQGLGSQRCEMKYLSRQAAVTVGDVIITSGMGGSFPKGIRIGEVMSVRKGGDLLQRVEVHPSAALDRLEEVIVLLGDDPVEEP